MAQPAATPLAARGYAVIPTPQSVVLSGGDVELNDTWTLDAGTLSGHIAVRSLLADLKQFHGLNLKGGTGPTIHLTVRPGAVTTPGDAEIGPQAYRLQITAQRIDITGNGDAGLLYGVQTLLQLLKRGPRATLLLPAGTIDDWPRLQLRFLHWDTKNHQDRMETLKRYLDWAVRFKVNMIGFELEDKFEYPSLPEIGAPGAFTTAQLQEIVNYGLERFIQVVPVIQAPAHFSYVLKHPRFAGLRADGNNYQADLCQEDSYKLIFQMYDDVIQATKGVKYFFVSTDEIYYAGVGPTCKAPYNPENRSLQWAEFARRAHDHMTARGRTMLAWLEYPLLPQHLKLIPSDVIDGVIGEESFIPIEVEKKMRQLIYVSLQGGEYLFPDHLPGSVPEFQESEFEESFAAGRLRETYGTIASGRPWRANPIGVFGAVWDDSGIHNETFWLGWSAVASWGWHPGTPGPEQHAAEFMRTYYGPDAEGMVEVYRMMEHQARSWQRTWDRVISKVRGPGYGSSQGPGMGVERYDFSLPLPALPRLPGLDLQPQFAISRAEFVAEAKRLAVENDQLLHALSTNLLKVDRNQYNLEVFSALAGFMGHHWRLLQGEAHAEKLLGQAAKAAAAKKYGDAVQQMVAAYNTIEKVHSDGAERFTELTRVFEVSRFPKGRAVASKKYLHVLDDTKDHWAARTPDLTFMNASEQNMGLAVWLSDLRRVIEDYAATHHVTVAGLSLAPQ